MNAPDRRSVLLGAGAIALMPSAAIADVPQLNLSQLYRDPNIPDGLFADDVARLQGRRVLVSGFIAPHGGRLAAFHVVAAEPLTQCPHCGPSGLPPASLIAYFGPLPPTLPIGRRLNVTGMLDLGPRPDPVSGFISFVRLRDADLRAA